MNKAEKEYHKTLATRVSGIYPPPGMSLKFSQRAGEGVSSRVSMGCVRHADSSFKC